MSDASQGPGWWLASDGKWYPPETAPQATPPPPLPGNVAYQPAYQSTYSSPTYGRVGKREKIGIQILLAIVTFGIYGIYWAYKSHEEVKQYSGEGVGGLVGALIYAFIGVVTLFLLPLEIQKMYEREGRKSPVSAATAFWILLFVIPWYVKCQNALNEFWASKGAPAP
jgi:hypothetical protein